MMRAELAAPLPWSTAGRAQSDTTRILPLTVVIPAHNRAVMLRRALESVAAQAPSRPSEVIVIDDASSDGTPEVAESMGARVIRHNRNLGPGVARNSGITAARQPWIALLDSDDEWHAHHLDALWHLRGNHVLVAASVVVRAGAPATERFSGPVSRRPVILTSPSALVYPQNFVSTSATMIRRRALLDAGAYRPELRRSEDLDLLLRVLEQGTGIVTPEIGVVYHEHPRQASRQRQAMRAAHQDVAASYIGRAWMSSSLLRRMSGAMQWDELRAALATGRKLEALKQARLVLSHPERALGAAGLLAWRRLGRDRGSAMRHSGRASAGGAGAGARSSRRVVSRVIEALLLHAVDLAPISATPPSGGRQGL